MIGNPNWFQRRKWGGWGLSPASWQGWVYIGVFVALMLGTNYLPFAAQTNLLILGGIGIVLVVDTLSMMMHLKQDERERIHEAIAERNALWAILLVLVIGVAYEAARNAVLSGVPTVDPVIIAALVVGLITKAGSNYYLDRKD
jgi:energy-converting hydrogenase Eha subunit C